MNSHKCRVTLVGSSFIKHLRNDITKKSFAFFHSNLGLDDASIIFNMSRGMENSFIFVI